MVQFNHIALLAKISFILSILPPALCKPVLSIVAPLLATRSSKDVNITKRENGPVTNMFAMMGDSYGSGVGAGKQWIHGDAMDLCKRGDMSVGAQLEREKDWWKKDDEEHELQFVACSGTKSYQMLKVSTHVFLEQLI
jgi:hypothetical protein